MVRFGIYVLLYKSKGTMPTSQIYKGVQNLHPRHPKPNRKLNPKKKKNPRKKQSNLCNNLQPDLQKPHHEKNQPRPEKRGTTISPGPVPVQILRIALQDASASGPAGEDSEGDDCESHAETRANARFVGGETEKADWWESDENAREETEQQCLHYDSTEVRDGKVAEDQNGADESARDDDVDGPNLIRQHVGQGAAEDRAGVENRHEVEGHGAVGDAARFAEVGDVEELDVQADETYERAEHEGHEGEVAEGGRVD